MTRWRGAGTPWRMTLRADVNRSPILGESLNSAGAVRLRDPLFAGTADAWIPACGVNERMI